MRCENLHSVKETSEHDNLQTSHVHKINWNFGISTGYTWKKPYKSSTYEVPILQNKFQFFGICSNFLESRWNFGIGRHPTLTRYLSYPRCTRPRTSGRARENKDLVSKAWDKKIPPNLSAWRYG